MTEELMMEENKITTITQEKTELLKDTYKDTLEILDAYDHQTLTRPEGTYYDGNESIEEVAVGMLYDMIKNPVWYDSDKQMAAIKFLLFLEWNNALFVDGGKRISDTLLVALILMIEKSRDEDKEMIIRTVLNCIC
jgi:prophage maintenance system killer protein